MPEREYRKITFARPLGIGGLILKAVGRLSSLYLLKIKGAPTGANGRIDCFKLEGSDVATGEDDFEQESSALFADLLLSGTTSVC